MAGWYAVHTKPQQERRAEEQLRSLGVEVFLPQVLVPARAFVSRRPRVEPLFPRYLFVCCDIAAKARQIRFTRGVSRIVGNDDGPLSIDDGVIGAIRSSVRADGTIRVPTELRQGDRVRITSGPLKDIVGMLESNATSAERVRIFLTTVTGDMHILTHTDLVESIG